MKLLIFLAVLTFVRGNELEQSDEVLRELESLVDGKVAKENDDRELEELIKTIEDENKPEPLSDEAFEKQMLALELQQNDFPGPGHRGYRPKPKRKHRKGDAKCFDAYGKCQTRIRNLESKCKNSLFKDLLGRKCSFSCGFCKTARCEDSRFGCCRKGSNEQADGKGLKGCRRKLCYDISEQCIKKAKDGECEGNRGERLKELCPLSCKVCSPKAHAKQKCDYENRDYRGHGCCDGDGSTIALGPKKGCKDKPIFGKFTVPKPTCVDIGYGCCRTDGSQTATGTKIGCPGCNDYFAAAWCRRITSEKKFCHEGGPRTIMSFKNLCPATCGYCNRYRT